MYILIDNYDSFVYNLASYISELGRKIKVVRNEDTLIDYIVELLTTHKLEGIIISPGPKSPLESGISGKLIKLMAGKVPILGVCLGHQIIAYEFGATIEKGRCPVHGKVTSINHNEKGLFDNIPSPYEVTRYHSLVVSEQNLPDCFCIDAKTEDGIIMAISHKEFPLYGVQFHPEALLTKHGHKLLENYFILCERWWQDEKNNSERNRLLY